MSWRSQKEFLYFHHHIIFVHFHFNLSYCSKVSSKSITFVFIWPLSCLPQISTLRLGQDMSLLFILSIVATLLSPLRRILSRYQDLVIHIPIAHRNFKISLFARCTSHKYSKETANVSIFNFVWCSCIETIYSISHQVFLCEAASHFLICTSTSLADI